MLALNKVHDHLLIMAINISHPARNAQCTCGSGKRFKECHGRVSEGGVWAGLTKREHELLPTVLAVDEEGLEAGRGPAQRAFDTAMKATERLYPGRVIIMTGQGAGTETDEIHDLIGKLYRPRDIGVGGLHVGVFMFRDIFARIEVPLSFGHNGFSPLRATDLNDTQKAWIQSRPQDFEGLCDQFIDLFDFGYGLEELGHTRLISDDSQLMMQLASFQLQAAASTLLTAFDRRGAVQAALLATEMALKGGLIANGLTIDELRDSKKFGHHHHKLAAALAALEPGLDRQRVETTIAKFPAFVPNRYSSDQPTRIEAGHIVMGAQYIAAEVMRQLTDRDLRATGGAPTERVYPSLE
jgi:hypothetical protein